MQKLNSIQSPKRSYAVVWMCFPSLIYVHAVALRGLPRSNFIAGVLAAPFHMTILYDHSTDSLSIYKRNHSITLDIFSPKVHANGTSSTFLHKTNGNPPL